MLNGCATLLVIGSMMPDSSGRAGVKVSFTLSPVVADQVQQFAENLKVSTSEGLRMILMEGVACIKQPDNALNEYWPKESD